MCKNNFKYDIAILRLLAILIVVAFHGYGMVYVHFSTETNELFHKAYYHFNQTGPINVAMPLFVWISGFLFGRELFVTPPPLKQLAQRKAKRILLPYFIFSVVFMLTTNSFSLHPFWQGGYWHLWFLPMLFWCFILSWFLNKIDFFSNKFYILLVLGAFCAPFIKVELPHILGLNALKNWYCWFLLGIISFKYDTAILRIIRQYHLIIPLIAVFIIIQIFSPTLYENYTIEKNLANVCAVYSLYYITRQIPWQNFWFTDILITLSGLSFGIYVFHNWVEMMLLSNKAQQILHIEQIAINHIWLFPIVFVLIALLISSTLTFSIKQTRIGRNLL